MNKSFITAMSVLCTMAAFLFTLTFTACGDDDDNDDDSSASTYEEETDEEAERSINGYDYVDLGLSVVWATCNVGASSPEEYGDYYAWGETETKSNYLHYSSETYGKDIDDISGTDRDVAHVEWGGTWRMPTKDEFEELLDSCTWTWTTLNEMNGYKVTSMINSNYIFLPAAGRRGGTSLYSTGSDGDYWSSTPSRTDNNYAYQLDFGIGSRDTNVGSRANGRTVRPVSE